MWNGPEAKGDKPKAPRSKEAADVARAIMNFVVLMLTHEGPARLIVERHLQPGSEVPTH